MANFTKNAIKKTFISLLEQKPLNQITVKLIVGECGINRNSFYYHYRDIPELIEEIIKEEANRIISEYPTVGSVETALKAAFGFATQNRRAIMHIYNSVSRDIFERYLWEVCSYIVSSYGKTIPGSEKLNEFDSELISRFFICQCFGIVMNWLNGKQTEDVSKQISRFCAIQRGLAEEMINKCIDK